MISFLVGLIGQPAVQELLHYGIVTYEQYAESRLQWGRMITTFSRVSSLIHHASDKQLTDVHWRELLQSYDNVEYDVHDLKSEFGSEFSKLESWWNNLGGRISVIQHSLVDILGRINEFRGDLVTKQLDNTRLAVRPLAAFGRESDKLSIIHRMEILEKSSGQLNVSVIPIIGTIGIGKTTLALLLYNHEAYRDPFDLKICVSAPKRFDITSITKSIVEENKSIVEENKSIVEENSEISHSSNFCSLSANLGEIFGGKRFLLVLDNLYDVDPLEWDRLLTHLKRGLRGSVVIVTTGSQDVLSLEGMSEPYDLKCLSDQDCWLLLKQQALVGRNWKTIQNLEEIGKSIAKKCKGLPLAVMIIGRLLRSSRADVNVWKDIQKSMVWDSPLIKDHIMSALNCGYGRLPFCVWQCLAYCSMFPQGYRFEKDKIVRMWMGEGLILTDEPSMSEEKGRDYIDQLFGNSFFQMKDNVYIIQDAVHELVQSASSGKFLRLEKENRSRIKTDTRHLSLVCNDSEAWSMCKRLRTFLMLGAYDPLIEQVPRSLFKVQSLRVLDLSGTRLKELKVDLGNLKYLHFLDLSNTCIVSFPRTVEKLCDLQTLRLVNCEDLHSLQNIEKLKSLQHLELGGNIALFSMPPGIGNLTGLQTVNEFIVGRQSGQMKELKGMNSIRGSLCIKQLENVKDLQESLDANLAEKKGLDVLELEWSQFTKSDDAERVLYNIMNYGNSGASSSSSTSRNPPIKLKELTLKNYGGRSFPTWVSLLPELTRICFYQCEKCRILPPLGNLPELKFLEIFGMHDLVMLDKVFLGHAGFKSLETLEIRDMSQLKSWVDLNATAMVSLRELTVKSCPQMLSISSLHYLRSLETLTIEDCPKLQGFSDGILSRTVQSLVITDCPILEEQCKINGADWMKIRDIPGKTIGTVTTT